MLWLSSTGCCHQMMGVRPCLTNNLDCGKRSCGLLASLLFSVIIGIPGHEDQHGQLFFSSKNCQSLLAGRSVIR